MCIGCQIYNKCFFGNSKSFVEQSQKGGCLWGKKECKSAGIGRNGVRV